MTAGTNLRHGRASHHTEQVKALEVGDIRVELRGPSPLPTKAASGAAPGIGPTGRRRHATRPGPAVERHVMPATRLYRSAGPGPETGQIGGSKEAAKSAHVYTIRGRWRASVSPPLPSTAG